MSRLVYQPRNYQVKTTDMIIENKRLLVVLEMGLGKTVATLTAIDSLMCDHFVISKTLVIAPKRVAEWTWPEEIHKWQHLKDLTYSILTGHESSRIKELHKNSHLYIINIDNLVWLVNYIKLNNQNKWPFDMIVIDESSTVKNPSSERFKALKKVVNATDRMVLLSGTPAPNGLQDIWSQIYLIDGGERLGKNITAFRNRYMIQNPYIHSWKMKENVEEDIYNKISDVSFVLRSKGNIKLPDVMYNNIVLDMSNKSYYTEMERNYFFKVDESAIVAGSAAVLSNKLLQLANGFAYDEDGEPHVFDYSKANALANLIDGSSSVLIFYWFKQDLETLKFTLADYKPRELKDDKDKDDWNAGKVRVLLAHPASTGHGLNLQYGGHVIIWYSLTWSLELYEQANARLYRSGQQYPTVIHHLICKDTIDEEVIKRLSAKKLTQDDIKEAIIARRRQYEQSRIN